MQAENYVTIFLESFWIWVGIAFGVGAVGYVFYMNNQRPKTLGITGLAVILVLAVGFSLYFFVDTDRKSVCRMLDGLIAAIEADDVDRVVKDYISPKARNTAAKARGNMALVTITDASYRNLKLEVNNLMSPPIAKAKFTGVFFWMTKGGGFEGIAIETPQYQAVRFNIELEKTKENSWRVTDKCDFDPKALP